MLCDVHVLIYRIVTLWVYVHVLDRFHVLTEFDEAKRSCRKRLAEHNRRRRKPAAAATTAVAAAKDAAAAPVAAGKKPSGGAATSYTGDNKSKL